MSDFSDSDSETECSFNSAAETVQRIHGELSQGDVLELYGLYKQVTCGPCNIAKPNIMQVQARSKWNAWNALGSMDQRVAKRLYIEKVSRLHPGWESTSTKVKEKTGWAVHSIQIGEPEDPIDEKDKTAFDFVKENDLSNLKRVLNVEAINTPDRESGMGLIHWAADRNAKEILQYLLDVGANINLRDADGQTCLHYASSCGHIDCIRVLIKYGADKELCDNDGNSPLDVADDDNIRKLLLN